MATLVEHLPYIYDPYGRERRRTRVVMVGDVGIGGTNPIRVQSMTTTRTQDIDGTTAQALRLIAAGCEIVRITAPTASDAKAIGEVRRRLRVQGHRTPLVADIHFSPGAALEAAEHVEKVRINPGNYADSKTFAIREYTDAQYQAEIERIAERFVPLVQKCEALGVAMRVGTNHGSLSDRIMNRFGDTPLGMVESALEFLQIARDEGYYDIVLSMKASNPKVMIQAYRLLVARMDALGWDYPLHLGVTEAGNGADGRLKSAVGIGTLLDDGLGDTIRVSLTEEPEAEIPVAQRLAAWYSGWPVAEATPLQSPPQAGGRPRPIPPACGGDTGGVLPDIRNPYEYERRFSREVLVGSVPVGGRQPVAVVNVTQADTDAISSLAATPPPDIVYAHLPVPFLVCRPVDEGFWAAVEMLLAQVEELEAAGSTDLILGLEMGTIGATIRAGRLLAARLAETGRTYPIHLVAPPAESFDDQLLGGAIALGSLLCDGIGDSVQISAASSRGARPCAPTDRDVRLAFNILQAAGVRITRTEYVACPGCGRTLFDLQSTTDRIKAQTDHLTGVKIAVMGCVVNGPGEMADADFGYVGGAPGQVNLYVGKECVERNVPQAEADERLIALIKAHGKWVETP